MKKIAHLIFTVTLLVGCSKDDGGFVDEEPQQEIPDDTEEPEEPEEPTEGETQGYYPEPGETASYMVDPDATSETVALFYNLKINSKTDFLIGQQDAFNAFYTNAGGDSDMKKLTGSDPALLGSDFMFITDDNNNGEANNFFYQQEVQITGDAIEAYNKGMVNIFCWHLREPYEGDEFYTSAMSEFQKANAFKSILPNGINHDYYKQKLQKVAEVAKSLVGSNGTLSPIIFRPFHEFDGDFFWWGAAYSTPEEFKTVWRFTVEYLRDEMDVHNILYAYAPDNSYSTKSAYMSRYPGDEYVDIMGMDNYGDLSPQDGSRIDLANAKLKVVSDLALEHVKIAALSETGYFVDADNQLGSEFYSTNLYNVLTNNNVQVGFMMFWQNSNETYTVPVPGVSGEADFLSFIEKEKTTLLDDLPAMYTMPN